MFGNNMTFGLSSAVIQWWVLWFSHVLYGYHRVGVVCADARTLYRIASRTIAIAIAIAIIYYRVCSYCSGFLCPLTNQAHELHGAGFKSTSFDRVQILPELFKKQYLVVALCAYSMYSKVMKMKRKICYHIITLDMMQCTRT